MHTDSPIPAQLSVVAWSDPVIDALGFSFSHCYSEIVALPHLGPSATLAWRRLAGTLAQRPDGFTLELVEFAHAQGLGAGTARNAPVSRTLRRLAAFGLARFVDDATYAVRRYMPPVSGSQLRRLRPEIARIHTALLAAHDAERRGDTRPPIGKGA